MVVSSVTYLIEWKTAAMPIIWLQRSGVAWPRENMSLCFVGRHTRISPVKRSHRPAMRCNHAYVYSRMARVPLCLEVDR